MRYDLIDLIRSLACVHPSTQSPKSIAWDFSSLTSLSVVLVDTGVDFDPLGYQQRKMYIMHITSTPTTPLLQPEQTDQTSETETVIQLTPLDSSFTQWRDWERRALGSGEANATTTENATVISSTSSSASPFFTSGGAVEGSNSDTSSGITKVN